MSTARRRRRYLRWVRYDLRCTALTGPHRGLLKPEEATDPYDLCFLHFIHNGRWRAAVALNNATRSHYGRYGQDIRMRLLWPPRG